MKNIKTFYGAELVKIEYAQNNRKTCLISNNRIKTGEKIVTVINGGNQWNSRTTRSIKFKIYKQKILKLLGSENIQN